METTVPRPKCLRNVGPLPTSPTREEEVKRSQYRKFLKIRTFIFFVLAIIFLSLGIFLLIRYYGPTGYVVLAEFNHCLRAIDFITLFNKHRFIHFKAFLLMPKLSLKDLFFNSKAAEYKAVLFTLLDDEPWGLMRFVLTIRINENFLVIHALKLLRFSKMRVTWIPCDLRKWSFT